MKFKSIITCVMAVISVASCSESKATAGETLTVDSVKYEQKDKAVEASVSNLVAHIWAVLRTATP